jgi:hypothetical protein
MSRFKLLQSIFLMLLISPAWAATYWQCIAQDGESKQWTAKSTYQRMANTKAFEACKKESHIPATCTVPEETCVYLNQVADSSAPVVVTKAIHNQSRTSNGSLWQCTALDWRAKPWLNRPAPNQDAAAMSAKAFCQRHSSLPDTCYVNLITCRNVVR